MAVDRGQYSSEEWHGFNTCDNAAFTIFNPFNFSNAVEKINPADWQLVLLSRHDFASWLLSLNALNHTNLWHPGKECKIQELEFKQEVFMSSYWFYICWYNMIYRLSDTFGFKKVIKIDFDDLKDNWNSAGKLLDPNWDWQYNSEKMKLGMTITWANIKNLDEVLSWIPDQTVIDNIKKSL
jgi:hypothetical protein